MVWGVPAFLALWVGAGVSGGLAGLVLQKRRELKGHAMVGASGSVLGLSAAVACQFPRAKLYIMPFVSLFSLFCFIHLGGGGCSKREELT